MRGFALPASSKSCSDDVRHAELQRTVGGDARGDQVLDDFVLRVDRDRMAGQLGQRDAAALPFERQFETVVQRAFGLHPRAEARFVEQVHRALFEHAGADRRFDRVRLRASSTTDSMPRR